MIEFDIFSDDVVETDEQIVVTLSDTINRGANFSTEYDIREGNII